MQAFAQRVEDAVSDARELRRDLVGDGSVSSTCVSLGKGLDPPMPRMDQLERLAEPSATSLRKPGHGEREVVLVLLGAVRALYRSCTSGTTIGTPSA